MRRMGSIVALLLLNVGLGVLAAHSGTVCGGENYISANGGELIFIVNAWNATSDGFQCVSVNNDANQYNATWQWPENARTSVHSYPHVKFQPSILPIPITSLNNLTLAASWSISADSKDIDSTTTGMVANVAWDLFADADKNVAQVDSQAGYEVMIWVGRYGNPAPIGKVCMDNTITIAGAEFTLWCGSWRPDLTTYSWVSQKNVTNFNADFSPLFQSLISSNKLPSNVYLGVIGFGTEAFYAADNVTFMASNFDAHVNSSLSPRAFYIGKEAGFLCLAIFIIHSIVLLI